MGRNLSSGSIFVVAALFCGLCTPLFAATYAEQEPNDTKYAGNVIPPMVAGDVITGYSEATFSTGDFSPDYFLVQTAVFAWNYQHRLRLTITGSPPVTDTYNASILGLEQVAGVIQPNTETTAHSAPPNGYANHPRRTVQWYGFGRGERIYFRISGNSNTTSNYVLTLETTPVLPQIVEPSFEPGPITISNASTDPFTHFDLWVYTANLNAIPGYGPNAPTSLAREFAAGTYYIALAKFDLSNNLPSPDGPSSNPTDHQNSPVLDFPDAVVVKATLFNSNISVNINGHVEPATVSGVPYNIVWLKLTVGVPGCVCLGDLDGNTLVNGRDMATFVTSVLSGEGECADTNSDTQVNSDDIPSFVGLLLAGNNCN